MSGINAHALVATQSGASYRSVSVKLAWRRARVWAVPRPSVLLHHACVVNATACFVCMKNSAALEFLHDHRQELRQICE